METKTDAEWKKKLTPGQYRVLREKGTEMAFTGEYDNFFGKGMYKCAGCGTVLFSSDFKYDSGCGWPAFFEAFNDRLTIKEDNSHGMRRTEVMCKKCGGHEYACGAAVKIEDFPKFVEQLKAQFQ